MYVCMQSYNGNGRIKESFTYRPQGHSLGYGILPLNTAYM